MFFGPAAREQSQVSMSQLLPLYYTLCYLRNLASSTIRINIHPPLRGDPRILITSGAISPRTAWDRGYRVGILRGGYCVGILRGDIVWGYCVGDIAWGISRGVCGGYFMVPNPSLSRISSPFLQRF
jgi:hypothetical protein